MLLNIFLIFNKLLACSSVVDGILFHKLVSVRVAMLFYILIKMKIVGDTKLLFYNVNSSLDYFCFFIKQFYPRYIFNTVRMPATINSISVIIIHLFFSFFNFSRALLNLCGSELPNIA